MKKYILPGIFAAMALSLPLAAQAQTSPTFGGGQASPVISQPATPSSSTFGQTANPYRTPSSGINAPYSSQYQAAPFTQTGVQTQNPGLPSTQLGTPPASGMSNQQSQSTTSQSTTTSTTQIGTVAPINTSGEVIVGKDSASSIVPPLQIGMSGTTMVTVVNPTPKPVTFSVPAINMTYEIPGNSQRTIQIDRAQTANLTPGQVVAYYVNDSSGNQIASSNLTQYSTVASQINTDTTVATESSTSSTETKTSAEPAQTPRRSTVRGFW